MPTADAPCPTCGYLCFFPDRTSAVANSSGGTSIQELLEMLESRREPPKLALNFQRVSFMSSSMITKLVVLSKEIRSRGGKLVFCNVSSNVREVFKITKLDKLFDMVGD